MHKPRIEVCVECGQDWHFERASCYRCGCEDHETRDQDDLDDMRNGGLDIDASYHREIGGNF